MQVKANDLTRGRGKLPVVDIADGVDVPDDDLANTERGGILEPVVASQRCFELRDGAALRYTGT